MTKQDLFLLIWLIPVMAYIDYCLIRAAVGMYRIKKLRKDNKMDDYNTKDFLQRRGRKPLDEVLERLLRLFKQFRLIYKRPDGKTKTIYFEQANLFYFDDEIIVIIEPSYYFDDSAKAAERLDYNKVKIIKVSAVLEIAGF